MPMSLDRLRRAAQAHRVLIDDSGFSIERRTGGSQSEFDALVREALDSSGQDFVAFPCPDARSLYRAVYVIPLDPPT
jgi:hypothetical protein